MIPVVRTQKPNSLRKNEAKWVQKIREALNLTRNATTITEIKKAKKKLENALNKYKHTDIKEALVEQMFRGKCAYCEAQIIHIDYGDIEHFRPKDTFPLLAVEWENLLFVCRVCNGAEFKGTKFPLDTSDNPLLINPCEDTPNNHLEFKYEEKTQFATVVSKDEKGLTSINTYGLNRSRNEYDLLKRRSKYVTRLVAIAICSHENPRMKVLLDEACENTGEYSAFAKMVREKYVEKI